VYFIKGDYNHAYRGLKMLGGRGADKNPFLYEVETAVATDDFVSICQTVLNKRVTIHEIGTRYVIKNC